MRTITKNLIKHRIRSESSVRIILSVILLGFSNSLVFAEYKNINASDNKSNTISSTNKNTQSNNSSQGDSTSSIASSVGKDTVGGNPAFTSFDPGTGALGRFLQIPDDWGVRLGGVSLADTNKLFTGGNKPGSLASNQVFILGTSVDTEKAIGWKGGHVGVSFLQLNAQNTNGYAGSVPGYNSITGAPPFNRTELYEYWVTQELIKDTLKVRVGKIIPSVDFNNVTRTAKMKDNTQNVSSLSGLLYTSIFVNPSLLGVIGGYVDSVFGVTTNLAPTKNTWITVGSYDGNKARGFPTGLHNPHLSDGYVFNIAEAGMSWTVGEQNHPGQFGAGVWYQTGKFDRPGIYGNLQNTGEGGLYLYGGQRVWAGDGIKAYSNDEPDENINNGFETRKVASVSIFYQYGLNNSKTMPIRQFSGVGFTAFSMIADRPDDSFGAGMGLSFLNQNLFQRASELMFQTYYQACIIPDTMYLQPTLSYIPTPGQIPSNLNYTPAPGMAPNLPPALAGTLRLTSVF